MQPIGIVGLGIVGRTVREALADAAIPTRGYDLYQGEGHPSDMRDCAVVLMCVPTPCSEHGGYDLTEVWACARMLAEHLDPGAIIAVKSTVPPGTCDRLHRAHPQLEFASVPEFLVATKPRESFHDAQRIIIGARTFWAGDLLEGLMHRLVPGAAIVRVRPIEAELLKLSANALLAAKVTVANELAEVCASHGVRWSSIQHAIGMDPRIGPAHLTVTPERGFGGQCLPKDLDGLIAASREAGHFPSLLAEIARFNRRIRGKRPNGASAVTATGEAMPAAVGFAGTSEMVGP
jgi:UDPglucose 6-dehydrogenase